ncbi:unnamed protein product [Symbiodinium microadriaticum]|nr:unnamed protein product [Symbiodinium microadriaticum]
MHTALTGEGGNETLRARTCWLSAPTQVIQLPPITLDNCHEREDGDLQWLSLTVRWDEITFEEEVNGKYWHAVIMALHRIREDFVKKQWRKMKHLDWYMTMKKTSDKRNAKYYAACLEGLSQHCGDSRHRRAKLNAYSARDCRV